MNEEKRLRRNKRIRAKMAMLRKSRRDAGCCAACGAPSSAYYCGPCHAKINATYGAGKSTPEGYARRSAAMLAIWQQRRVVSATDRTPR